MRSCTFALICAKYHFLIVKEDNRFIYLSSMYIIHFCHLVNENMT